MILKKLFLTFFSLLLYSISFQSYFCYNFASASLTSSSSFISPSRNMMNRILIAGGRHKKIGRSLMKKKRFISSKSRLSSTPTSLSSVSSPLSTSHSSIPSSSFSSSLSSLISPSLLLYGGLLPTSSVSSTSTFPLISPLSSTFSKEKEKKNLLSFLCLLEEEQFYLLPKSLPLLDKDGNETSKSFFICQVPGDGGCLFHALSLSLLYQYYKINGLDSLNLLLKNLPQSLKKSLEKQEKLLGGNENEINDNNLSTSSLLSSSYSIKRFWQDLSYRLRLLACENLQSESILYLEGQDEKHSPVSTQFYPMKSRNNSPTTNIDSTSLTSTDESEKENDSEILASDLLLLSSQHYSLTPEKYIDLMKKPQTWGGGPEIISLLNHFQCPIYVYQLAVKDNEFVLQITAKFGHPFFKDKEPLHFLCADGRFPNITPGSQKEIGDHFLALFPCDSSNFTQSSTSSTPILSPSMLSISNKCK